MPSLIAHRRHPYRGIQENEILSKRTPRTSSGILDSTLFS